MNEVNDKDVVDFFTEELSKKEKKEQKKKKKDKKKQAKKEKELEKIEDLEFAKKLEEKNKEEIIPTEITREKINVEKNIIVKKHPFLNFLLGLFIIVLFLTSCDYLIFNILKQTELKLIITSSLLCFLAITYILSIIIKKEGLKKFFQILATISIAAYMLYQLYII